MISSRMKNFSTLYAHRGLHHIEDAIPENSIRAFEEAVKNQYGVELDVQLSRDGQVVVFHDDTLKRVCGIDARVDQYTYEELSSMRLLQTEETIPLFTDVLQVLSKSDRPLIVELKTGPRNEELCRKTLDILKKHTKPYCIESFNPFIVRWFYKNAPEVVRGQLATGYKDYRNDYNPLIAKALSACWFFPLNKPDFIAYNEHTKLPKRIQSLRKKCALIAWTSLTPEEDRKLYDGVIFEKPRDKA